MSNKTVVRLLGNDYTIQSSESEEYMQRVAFFVDKKFNEIASLNSKLSTNMIAVLSAINIADEHFKLMESAEEMSSKIAEHQSKELKAKTAIEELKRKNELLNQEIQRLKIEIAKLEVRR